MDIALKLTVSPSDVPALRAHPLLNAPPRDAPIQRDFVDIYYDSPDLDLWRRGIVVRVREEGERWSMQAAARSAGAAGLHEPVTWDCALPDAQPRPADLARQIKNKRIAKLLAADGLGASFCTAFTIHTHRLSWRVALADGRQVACALDTGSMRCNGQAVMINELDLRWKKGNCALLFEFALALHEEIPMQIMHESKAARGFALLAGTPPAPVKAFPVRLTAKMSLEDALRRMGLNCLVQMEANETGVVQKNAESLHQLRVGVRRLRALLDMFGELAPTPPDIATGLAWLANELGTTRDWDVLAGSTLDSIAGVDAAPLRAAALEKAGALHQQLLLVLGDARYTTLMLRLKAWLLGRHWRCAESAARNPLAKPARRGMAPLLKRAARRLTKRVLHLDRTDAADRHRMRIAAKKARYAAEFFTDLLPGKPVKRYISSLSRLQDRLGTLNDLAVADRLLAGLDGAGGDAACFARGYFSAVAEAELPLLQKSLDAVARLKLPA